jgi:hypothetical protein
MGVSPHTDNRIPARAALIRSPYRVRPHRADPSGDGAVKRVGDKVFLGLWTRSGRDGARQGRVKWR